MVVRSERDGRVARLAARAIGHAGMLLGAGRETVDGTIDPAVGFVFHKKVGDPVAVGEPIVTVHLGKASRREAALARLAEAIVVAPEAPARAARSSSTSSRDDPRRPLDRTALLLARRRDSSRPSARPAAMTSPSAPWARRPRRPTASPGS